MALPRDVNLFFCVFFLFHFFFLFFFLLVSFLFFFFVFFLGRSRAYGCFLDAVANSAVNGRQLCVLLAPKRTVHLRIHDSNGRE